jgi:hypothetical protein
LQASKKRFLPGEIGAAQGLKPFFPRKQPPDE